MEYNNIEMYRKVLNGSKAERKVEECLKLLNIKESELNCV